eukprot:768377-Hanusia_phi.AAC.11
MKAGRRRRGEEETRGGGDARRRRREGRRITISCLVLGQAVENKLPPAQSEEELNHRLERSADAAEGRVAISDDGHSNHGP